MYYYVDCPGCGKQRALKDDFLWPDRDGAPDYPAPSTPQACLDCPEWMRVVIDSDDEPRAEPLGKGWRDYTPDWMELNESRGKVDLLGFDGSIITGSAEIKDMSPGPEECPLWEVTLDKGEGSPYFFDYAGWRPRV